MTGLYFLPLLQIIIIIHIIYQQQPFPSFIFILRQSLIDDNAIMHCYYNNHGNNSSYYYHYCIYHRLLLRTMMKTTIIILIVIIVIILILLPNNNNNNNIIILAQQLTDEHELSSSSSSSSSSEDHSSSSSSSSSSSLSSSRLLSYVDDPTRKLSIEGVLHQSTEGVIHQSSSSISNHLNHEKQSLKSFIVDMTTISRTEFIKQFDTGIPNTIISTTDHNDDDIILLYTDFESIITNASSYQQKINGCNTIKVIMTKTPSISNNNKECIAIIENGNIESSSIYTWERQNSNMNVKNKNHNNNNRHRNSRTRRSTRENNDNNNTNDNNGNNNNLIIEKENKNHNHTNNDRLLLSSSSESESSNNDHDNIYQYKPYHYMKGSVGSFPTKLIQHISNLELINYLSYYENALKELESIAIKAGHDPITKERRPIIVMVMNLGHIHYFYNFICTATARHIDISNIIIFTTDQITYDIVSTTFHNNELNVYYNYNIFGNIPSSEPSNYNEKSYGRIFMSKVYCVHLINMLQYDVIFSDVDLVYYRNPTAYFINIEKQQQEQVADNNSNNDHDTSSLLFDIYISDNGGNNEDKFRPYHGNTGFYYIQYNIKTQYFLYCLLKAGDLILTENSHQSVFLMIAYEHSILRGLRIKTLYNKNAYSKYLINTNTATNNIVDPYDNELFAISGYEYLNKKRLMDMIVNGVVVPYIFHANRFEKHEKLQVLIRTNNWYMKYDQCSTSESLLQTYNNIINNNNLLNECCLLEPLTNINIDDPSINHQQQKQSNNQPP